MKNLEGSDSSEREIIALPKESAVVTLIEQPNNDSNSEQSNDKSACKVYLNYLVQRKM